MRQGRHATLSGRIVNRMVNSQTLDRTFSALADPTRRAMLERLSLGPAAVTELATQARISLPGALKHVRILEEADLVTSEKRGRTREVPAGAGAAGGRDRVDRERYRSRWGRRLDRLEAVIEKRGGGSR